MLALSFPSPVKSIEVENELDEMLEALRFETLISKDIALQLFYHTLIAGTVIYIVFLVL